MGPGIVSAPPLEIRIPDGWRGHRGPDGTGLLLRIAHARLGTEVEVWSFPRNGPPHPRPRAGCDDLFVDSGDTRALPGLPVAVTRSCIDEGGSLVQGWVAVVGDREIHVEVRHPPGTAYEGRVAVAPVLEGLAIGAAEPATRLR